MKIVNYPFDQEQYLQELRGLLQIESVALVPEAAGADPFGKGVSQALEYMLTLGRSRGMRVKNLDNRCAWIEWGEAPEMTGILAHVDTVLAAPEGWDTPPFDAIVQKGRVYGRGACDDKGPALLALHAMEAVSRMHDPKNLRLRLILGGDEESGRWKCMERYKQTEELPARAFSPDSHFPVTYAEKGGLQLRLLRKLMPGEIPLHISAGKVYNVVPSYARAELPDGEILEATGRSAHAMEPEKGDNALLRLCTMLVSRGISHPLLDLAAISSPEGLGIAFSDDVSGALTINPAIASSDGDAMELDYDIRIPVTVTAEAVIDAVTAHVSPLGFTVERKAYNPPLYVARDSHLVQTLQNVWQACTGRNDPPVSSGGATYARTFQNAVAFGVLFPEDEVTYHQPNEYYSLASMKKAFQILANAMANL